MALGMDNLLAPTWGAKYAYTSLALACSLAEDGSRFLHPTFCSALQQSTALPSSKQPCGGPVPDRLTYTSRGCGTLQCSEQFPSQLLHLL